jgi:hypothetical protein
MKEEENLKMGILTNKMKGKEVKIYKDTKLKKGYEGDARIERILKQLSEDTYLCDVSLDDSYFTYTVNINDILN